MEKEKIDIKKSIEEYVVSNSFEFMKKYKIQSIGIAMPGTAVDGVILTSGNVGINNYNLKEKLQEKIDLPITIRNDAKCAAVAESTYGVLKGYDRSIFLTLGTGIGGAAFIDGKLLTAGNRPGYEFGHMVIQKDGIECTCGRKGCFERYASMKVFKTNLRKVLGVDDTTRGEELLKIIRETTEKDEKYSAIQKVISEFIDNLSLGIVNLINIFEPQVIGIGGSFIHFEDVFLERLIEKVNTELKGRDERENIVIRTAVLGNDAGIIGATL
jgi:glucokinase